MRERDFVAKDFYIYGVPAGSVRLCSRSDSLYHIYPQLSAVLDFGRLAVHSRYDRIMILYC